MATTEIEQQTWYHTIELEPGVVTRGYFDTRAAARLVPMPASLKGLRCLDVGTYDGFWAFEMERRGAAEVVAVDVLDPRRWDWPDDSTPDAMAAIGDHKARSRGFDLAKEALGSRVERRDLSVYELEPVLVGEFDFVYCGSLLLHLRDPVAAVGAMRSVCRGRLLLEDTIDVQLSLLFRRQPIATLDGHGRPWWWRANVAGLQRMVESAGFVVQQGPIRFWMPFGEGGPEWDVTPRSLLTHQGREQALFAWRGDPHAAFLATPR
jgi:tRNA (mo5U34)-methyltransferase